MKSQTDETCIKCGAPIFGTKMHGESGAHEITWARRGTARGKLHVNPSCAQLAAQATEEGEVILEEEDDCPAPIAPKPDVAAILAALKDSGIDLAAASVKAPAKMKTPSPKAPGKKLTKGAWFEVLPVAMESGARRVLVVGPPGTGKSTTLQLLGDSTYRITMTDGTAVEDLLGSFQLKNTGKGTFTEFVKGPASLAMLEGKPLQIDEVTHTPEEIKSLLYALADDSPQVMLPNGEYIKAAPGYAFVCTTNDPPSTLEPAILDRMEVVLIAAKPHPDSLADCSPEVAAACNNFYNHADTSPWRFNRAPQVRPCRIFDKLRKAALLSDELIASAVFGDAGKEFLSAISTAAKDGGAR